jgi:hypothetical protein
MSLAKCNQTNLPITNMQKQTIIINKREKKEFFFFDTARYIRKKKRTEINKNQTEKEYLIQERSVWQINTVRCKTLRRS